MHIKLLDYTEKVNYGKFMLGFQDTGQFVKGQWLNALLYRGSNFQNENGLKLLHVTGAIIR